MKIQRVNQKYIESSFKTHFVTALIGPRRVGKTTLVKMFMSQYPDKKWVFLNMDYLEDRQRIEQGELEQIIVETAMQSIQGENKLWVAIDEAQKSPELFEQIKIIYDKYHEQDQIKFILTGSAMLDLHRLSAESLAGRVEILRLYEFTLRESACLQAPQIPFTSLFDLLLSGSSALEDYINEMRPFKKLLTNQLHQHMINGGLPEVVKIGLGEDDLGKQLNITTAKQKYMANYFQTYIDRDVRAIKDISDINLYYNMVEIIAEQTGSVRNDRKVADALGCRIETLKKYRGFLQATFFYCDLFPYIGSSLKRLVKRPKGYLLNNGLISFLSKIHDQDILEKTGMIGHRLENWFLNECMTWFARMPILPSLCYWQTSSGNEIDFIIEHSNKILPFEITNQKETNKKKERNLQTFMQDEPKATTGYIVYQGEYKVVGNIIYLPAWLIG